MNRNRFNTPQMFSDEPIAERLAVAQKISDLKNLGEASQKTFDRSGIKTVSQFVKLGWKKTLIKLCETDRRNCHTIFAYVLIGALKNIEWNQISDQDKKEAQEFTKGLRLKLTKKAR